MTKEENIWYVEINLPEGQYQYKYLINNQINLVDTYSTAYSVDEDYNLWSTLMVGKNGKRYYHINENKVNISGLAVTNTVSEIKNISSNKESKVASILSYDNERKQQK